ncbi:DUF389 domain-containing protein [Streptomyces sediminimaris]|uniref:DUF389 domain-containing protein n=1 Tax=Streptomyces sediminimaris TaxID=3383721 RepID=UPI00399BA34F
MTDSTATVIGAVIIAPLSTPFVGIAPGSVKRRRIGSVQVALLACLLVTAVGMTMPVLLPSGYDLLSNTQISSRTSPGPMDLTAALATGFAGAVALARRDVAAVLPGVAIAIPLVPPPVEAGVCLDNCRDGRRWAHTEQFGLEACPEGLHHRVVHAVSDGAR